MRRKLLPNENYTDDDPLPGLPEITTQSGTARAPDGTEYYIGAAPAFALRALQAAAPASAEIAAAYLERELRFIRPEDREVAVKAYLAGFRA